jgi:GntR family transcriptional regulator, transcriptional repressor for pyruvate dehydrogenase complex
MGDRNQTQGKEGLFAAPPQGRLCEMVSEQIKEAILTGRYKPGERLPSEKSLRQSLQVGRSVVREGLRSLESERLISIKRGSAGGVFAKELEPSALTTTFKWIVRLNNVSLEEFTATRAAVEMAVFRTAKDHLSPECLMELQGSIDKARKALEEGSRDLKNADFHLILARLTDNKLLMAVAAGLLELEHKFVDATGYSYKRKKIILEEHQHILDLLRKKKVEEAGRYFEKHIKNSACLFVDVKSSVLPAADFTDRKA